MPTAERPVTQLNSTSFGVREMFSVHQSSEMWFPGGNDDGWNGRVAHDVLADAALRREPDAASALSAYHDKVGALFVGDATDTFANILHCFASHLVLQLHGTNNDNVQKTWLSLGTFICSKNIQMAQTPQYWRHNVTAHNVHAIARVMTSHWCECNYANQRRLACLFGQHFRLRNTRWKNKPDLNGTTSDDAKMQQLTMGTAHYLRRRD